MTMITCKLTGKKGKPVDAHIIPESFYLIDKNDNFPLRTVTNTKGAYPKRIPKGIYDATILTHHGEKYFQRWDDYASTLLINKFSSTEPIGHDGKVIAYVYESYDYHKLKMFFISLLWRAGVSSHEFFRRVKLGPHIDKLKEAILTDNSGDDDFYAVNLVVFDEPKEWPKIMDPFPEKIRDIRYYRFYLGHFIAHIKVDQRKSYGSLRDIQLKPDVPLYIVQRDFWGSKEHRLMKKLIIEVVKKE